MYFKLLAGTALASFAMPAAAQTVIDTARTTPVATSTAGADLKITAAGSVSVPGGTAVTVDSDDNLTIEGKVRITNADGATGVLVTGPRVSDIVIASGAAITVDETYVAVDGDNDGDLDGPLAVGTGRAGIRIAGPLTGKVVQDGTILVEGNNSAGLAIGDTLTGTLAHNGSTTVVGNNSVGVSTRAITGDVRLAGTISATGENAVAAHTAGDIGGALVVQGNFTATGYRKTTAPTDTTKLDADDLLQGGSALLVEGNVAKGIVFAIAPKDNSTTDNDEDKDGIPDDKEGSAKIFSYGSAPAVVIGASDRDIAIGATAATGTAFGIINDGLIIAEGVYSGATATGMQLGGRGGQLAVANGMLNTGTIGAKAKNAAATALQVGARTALPELRNAGTIITEVVGTAGVSTAVRVDAGAVLPQLKNSGTIKATTVAGGTAYAVRDLSGTVALVENSGKIVATGATAGSGHNVAIDLSARSGGAIVRQTAVAAGATAPVIQGDVLLGSGADRIELQDGTVDGRLYLGAGNDVIAMTGDAYYSGVAALGGQADRIELGGSASFIGTADYAGGAGALVLADSAVFAGHLIGAQTTSVSVQGGTLDLRGATTIGSLSMGASSVLVATLNQTASEGTAITVNGSASFAEGAKIKLRLSDLAHAEGTYSVLTAGTLSGADKLTTDAALVPFLYKAALDVTGSTIKVSLGRKTTTELGLNQAEAAAFDGLYDALLTDSAAAGIFLGIQQGDVFSAYVQQTLPDFAGGTFEGISQGVRSLDRHLIDPEGPFDQEGTWRPMFDFVTYSGSKERDQSAAYDLDGLGFRGGIEYVTGVGAFGVSGSWLWNKHVTGAENTVTSNSYEGGVHWRGHFGALQTFARAAMGKADFVGSRIFAGGDATAPVRYEFARDWSGDFVTASGGASMEGGSQFFFFRPTLSLDYVKLKEDGYTETNADDADAFDLTVANRKSDEFGLNAALALGTDLFGMKSRDSQWLRMEVEGGWRELIGGALGSTTASYGDGDAFILLPEQRSSGWFARLRGFGGDGFYTIGGEAGAEERNGKLGYQFRASLRFGL